MIQRTCRTCVPHVRGSFITVAERSLAYAKIVQKNEIQSKLWKYD